MNDLKEITRFPNGIIMMPPSKSVSHRAIICAALSEGMNELRNISYSQDIDATIRCMGALGSEIQKKLDAVIVTGGLSPDSALLNCGESGTTLRFLIPIAALLINEIRFTGEGRLMQRPLEPYLAALSARGVSSAMRGNILSIKGPLTPGKFHLPGDVSSQFVSGLLLALPLLEGDSEIQLTSQLQSAPYVDLTIDMMAKFGVFVENKGGGIFAVAGGQKYASVDLTVEADYSQAAFFLVASALGCCCECRGLSPVSKQGDMKIIEILTRSGVQFETTPLGGVLAKPGRFAPQEVDVSDIPDLVPPLAAFFAFCEGESRIVGAGRLRHKESDRLFAVSSALNALGADIVMGEDRLTINGVKSLRGGRMDSSGDHRIAMMGAVAAIRSENSVFIGGSDSVAKSYPNFWQDFEKTSKEH